jgi:hypothetical protein
MRILSFKTVSLNNREHKLDGRDLAGVRKARRIAVNVAKLPELSRKQD